MSLRTLISTGTKVWLDSVDPDHVQTQSEWGVTGATSNPIIVADLIKTGRFDQKIETFIERGMDDPTIAWALTDYLVSEAQEVFQGVWEKTRGNDGYVSFELDPLLEDPQYCSDHNKRVRAYVDLGTHWGKGYTNRMIKVPATAAGLGALEELAANAITLNVTLIFSERQYKLARDAIWRGAQRRKTGIERFKSVYSIFVSRVDVYTEKNVPQLSPAAQGQVGIVNAKRIWRLNRDFWIDKRLPLQQEMIFASTGTKKPNDPRDKYVDALAGSDIQTNPPAVNEFVEKSSKQYTRQIDKLPPKEVLDEIDRLVDQQKMEDVLMREGTQKFSDPQKALLKLIAEKRAALAPAR
jgi:transaldolase